MTTDRKILQNTAEGLKLAINAPRSKTAQDFSGF